MAYAILKDVQLGIPQYMHKRKLLWMIGRSNDKPVAWAGLLDLWEEGLGQSRSELYGTWWGDMILLSNKPLESISTAWAGE